MTTWRESAAVRPGLDAPGLTQDVFLLLRGLIERRTGMSFDDSKRSILADKLAEGIASLGLTSFLDYYYLLRYDTDAGEHWSRLMDWLAVPETFFWRQPEQFRALADIVAPAHFASTERPLRIWSAASCTGEEPISIAIALAEAGFLGKQPIEITASDASAALVTRARRGVYTERAFRQLPEALRDRWFRDIGGGQWQVDETLLRSVRYSLVNLANAAEVAPFASSDVIFCRNVFIYFSDDAIRATVKVFADHMPPTGILFLSAAEALARLGVNFELTELGQAFAYVKGGQRLNIEAMRRPRAVAEPLAPLAEWRSQP